MMADFKSILDLAQDLLAKHFGGEVVFGEPQRLTEAERRSLVLRIPIREAPSAAPETVILKGPNLPAVPEAERPAALQGFFSDWAGSRFLDGLGDGHGPRFYGGSRDLQFILLEDFDGLPNMVGPLLEGTGREAEAALTRYMVRLGRMHAASAGQEAQFRAIASRVSPDQPLLRDTIVGRAKQLIERLEANTEKYGLVMGEAVQRDIQEVLEAALHPGPFLAYVHNDPCPDNLYDDGEVVRLIDFEVSGFGHALVDAVYPRMSFPSCWCANRVPRELVEALEGCYRAELVKGIPEAGDDSVFGQAVTAACGFWLLVDLGMRLGWAERDPGGMWGLATIPGRLATRTQAFARTAEQFGWLKALGEFALDFKEKLAQTWPEHEGLPEYPAFRGS